MEKPVIFSAVGDINLGDRALMVGLGVRSRICDDSTFNPFSGVMQIFSDSDLTFGNLECVLSDYGLDMTRISSRMMRGTPKSIQFIKEAGFNLLSIANNHIMQHGKRCFEETIQSILGEGILPIGEAGQNEHCIPNYIELKGLRFGFLGYSLRSEKYTNPPLYAQTDYSQIFREIQNVSRQCRFLIVSLHWGDEYMDFPAASQIEAAHAMIDNGASVVLGHHPHVLQGVEKYNGGVIAYSLGNFVFDVWQKKLRESMVLKIIFSEKGIEEIIRVPSFIGSNFAPRRAVLLEEDKISKRFLLLDNSLQSCLQGTAFSDKTYQKKVWKAELINQLQNRLFFFWQLPRYQRDVALQSLSGFVRSRLKVK